VVIGERPFLVPVTLETKSIDFVPELPFESAGMWVMTRYAAYLAFLNRMMRAHIEFGPLLKVALEANLDFLILDKEIFIFGMPAVAGQTAQVGIRMFAQIPLLQIKRPQVGVAF
jgi:hypothetical protein